MSMKQEEVTEIPLIYPLVSVTLKSTVIVEGRRFSAECEEVLNLDKIDDRDYNANMGRLLKDWEEYVHKLIATVKSPQGERALQSILDKHSQGQTPNGVDPQASPSELEALGQGKLSLALPAA